jgi:cation:H+ antiporter
MADMLLQGLFLAVCLGALPVTAGMFLSASEKIGLRLGVPPFVVGISVVAFGTSAPELVASIIAVLSGASEIVPGAVIGSNVTNILLVLAAAAIAGRGLRVDYDLVRVDLPFLFGSALLFTLCAFDGGVGALEGVLLLCALVIYIAYAVVPGDGGSTLAAGLVGLQLAAWGTVRAVVSLAALTPFGTDVLATSLVAAGTSLPELVVSLRAARQGKAELAVGNVIGSNVFNVLGVAGVAALCGAVHVTPELAGFGLASLLGATVLCFFVLQEREVTRWDGGLLLVLYAAFMLQLYGGAG